MSSHDIDVSTRIRGQGNPVPVKLL
jgi:hypothetical protein